MAALRLEDIAYTYDEYKHWKGEWELIDGIAVSMSPAPVRIHQSLAYTIARELGNQLEECRACEVLGEIDYKLSNDTVLKPDVVLTCDEQNDTYLTKAPEIIVEVISPSTAKRDEKYKLARYGAELVKYYILVYPDGLVAKIYKNENAKFVKQGDFSNQKYKFEDTSCKVELDFEKVFKRYRD